MTVEIELCRFCRSPLRADDDRNAREDAHAACVESSIDDRRASRAPSDAAIRRFLRVWWGAGHH